MVQYFDAADILKNKDQIQKAINKSSLFVRTGRIRNLIKKHLPVTGMIVDVGSGAAALPHSLREIGYNNIHLLDIDDYTDGTFTVHKLDVCKDRLPFDDETVDAYTAATIFEHLENPLHTIREIRRTLKKDGYLYVSLPSIHSLRSKARFFLTGDVRHYDSTNNHIFIYSRALISKFFKDFTLVETYYGEPYTKILGKRLLLPERAPIDRWFSNNVLYVFKKK